MPNNSNNINGLTLRELLYHVRSRPMAPEELVDLSRSVGIQFSTQAQVEEELLRLCHEEEANRSMEVTPAAPAPTETDTEDPFSGLDAIVSRDQMSARYRTQLQALEAQRRYTVSSPFELSYGQPTALQYSIPTFSTRLRGPAAPSRVPPNTNFEEIRRLPAKERKKKRTAAMERFVSSRGLKGAEASIQCGLEFEFHKLNRPNSNKFDAEQFNLDLALNQKKQSLYSLVYHQRYKDWSPDTETVDSEGNVTIVPTDVVEKKKVLSVLVEYVREKETQTVKDLPKEMRKLGAEYMDTLMSRFTEGWIERNRKNYISPADTNEIEGWDTVSSYTQLGTDGSVRGGEIRTLGGRTIREFLRAARVLSRNPFEVAEDTSFHIHLSLLDVEHKWGERFQAEMYAYLLRNVDRMPESVQKRLIAPAGVKYAKFVLENGHKYVAVYKHDDYNTWEFRLFGNVHKYSEMVQCLSLAVDTLRHVYAVRLGRAESLISKYGTDEIQHALNRIYDKRELQETDNPDPRPLRWDDSEEDDGDESERPLGPDEILIPGVGLKGFHQCLVDSARKIRTVEEDAA